MEKSPLHDFIVKKPQFNNPKLEKSIIRLNFTEPDSWTRVHPFIGSIHNWNPPKNVGKRRNRCTISNTITEVNDEEQFDEMINHLEEMTEWAVDLEHNDGSYLGITCLIQISTAEKNFLIDPFDLNAKIKQDLKPLMESGQYLKIFHGCYNDLRWLQRDYNIYAWPVVDTQVMYKKIGAIKNYPDCNTNISLVNFIGRYLPSVELSKDFTCSDFLERPLTAEQKSYAIQDTMYLLPALCELRRDLETASNRHTTFEYIIKFCVEYLAKKILYEKKAFPSVWKEIEDFKLKPEIVSVFKRLHAWRDDKAKVFDVLPSTIIFTWNLASLANLSNPSINTIEEYAVPGHTLYQMDFSKIKEIINTCHYKRLTLVEALEPCPNCLGNYHPVSFWPRRKQNCDFQGKIYLADWQSYEYGDEVNPESGARKDDKGRSNKNFDLQNISDEDKKNLTRMVRLANKFLYSKSSQLARYPFFLQEIQIHTNELLKKFVEKMNEILKCPICRRKVRKAVVLDCNCDVKPIVCKKCSESYCPTCQFLSNPFPFEPADTILREGQNLLKRCRGENTCKLFGAMVTFIRNTEMEFMCNYCFGPLENTMAVECGKTNSKFTSQCCRGCDELYIESYGRNRDPVPLKTFDNIVESFNSYIDVILELCKELKQPQINYPSVFNFGEQSHFKKKALKRLAENDYKKTYFSKFSTAHTETPSNHILGSRFLSCTFGLVVLSAVLYVLRNKPAL